MGFGSSIKKLINTYNNCLELLEVFRRRPDETTPESDAASLLQQSLRADRDKIQRRYASRLSEKGKRLERGDDKAKSVLRRTLKKLNAAIIHLLHFGEHDEATLPYDALKRLSNSSRIDAVNAIDQLSHRLGSSSSRRSLASSSAAMSSSSGDGHRRRRASAPDAGAAIASQTPTKQSSAKTRRDLGKKPSRKVTKEATEAPKKARRASESKRDNKKLSKTAVGNMATTTDYSGSTGNSSGSADGSATATNNNTIGGNNSGTETAAATTSGSDAYAPAGNSNSNNNSSSDGAGASGDKKGEKTEKTEKLDGKEEIPPRPRSPGRLSHRFPSRLSMANRMSMMTMSSVSTKIGEIPERRRLQRAHGHNTRSSSAENSEYNVPPTYPLKPYRTSSGSKSKGGFWGLFRR